MLQRSLTVARDGIAGPDRVRSRGEALQRLTADEYDTIELYTKEAGRDEYDLVAYLAGTWPAFLERLTVRTITRGRVSAEWDHQSARFVLAPPRIARRPRLRQPPHLLAASAGSPP
jgi:hypothetical protein